MIKSDFDSIVSLLTSKFPYYKHGDIVLLNCNCMDVMAMMPDKFFDLAVVDPPYGIDVNMNAGRKAGEIKKHAEKGWDKKIPEDIYYINLFRVSNNQIVWGGNYFPLPLIQSWIFWDKQVPEGVSFSSGELAWSSFGGALRKVLIPYSGFTGSEGKIHPTQKPIALYKWLYANYAKPNQLIFDSHGGSFSSAIAAHYSGVRFIGCELDEDYYRAAVERFKQATSQVDIFA